MIKGGGYVGARTREPPPTAQTIQKKLMWVRGVVCRSTRTQSLTVVLCFSDLGLALIVYMRCLRQCMIRYTKFMLNGLLRWIPMWSLLWARICLAWRAWSLIMLAAIAATLTRNNIFQPRHGASAHITPNSVTCPRSDGPQRHIQPYLTEISTQGCAGIKGWLGS
jgi:hypothetical protein